MAANEILQAFTEVQPQPEPASVWVSPFTANDAKHQFVFFIKPEATAVHDGVKLETVLNIVLDRFAAFDVTPGAIRVVNGPYLAQHRIMDRHYGVINAISKGGRSAISEGAEQKLQTEFGDALTAGVPVLGGHEFLQQNPDFSALALSTLNDNIGTTKLAGGTYLLSVKVAGAPFLILNPFHPYQLVPFTNPGQAIIVVEGQSTIPWERLRNDLTGATNPHDAAAGSIRKTLLDRMADTGMKDVSQGANGVHLSAGPLEGMVELRRFLTDPGANLQVSLADTAFGRRLNSGGVNAETLDRLATNPNFTHEGSEVSAFDLTEEVDADAAAELLTRHAS